jgi:hypothetical protein
LLSFQSHRTHASTERLRVPAVYLTSAFLPFLSERRMNNLRSFSGLDGSIPSAGTILLNHSQSISWAGRPPELHRRLQNAPTFFMALIFWPRQSGCFTTVQPDAWSDAKKKPFLSDSRRRRTARPGVVCPPVYVAVLRRNSCRDYSPRGPRPFDRRDLLPTGRKFVLGGEIVTPVDGSQSFDDFLMRIHPAVGHGQKLSQATLPCSSFSIAGGR